MALGLLGAAPVAAQPDCIEVSREAVLCPPDDGMQIHWQRGSGLVIAEGATGFAGYARWRRLSYDTPAGHLAEVAAGYPDGSLETVLSGRLGPWPRERAMITIRADGAGLFYDVLDLGEGLFFLSTTVEADAAPDSAFHDDVLSLLEPLGDEE